LENCDLCGNSLFREGYSEFKPESKAFVHPKLLEQGHTSSHAPQSQTVDERALDPIVERITDQVMKALNGAAH
ncbi:MAG TPA: class II aldolase/adducin family protein, partial [Isosphaeraceae bacterium]|nr:class II aldolase/adducin family protein [Isosphaeraceae bacterium]